MDYGTRQLVLWHKRRKQEENKAPRWDVEPNNSTKRVRALVFNPAVDVMDTELSSTEQPKLNFSTDSQSEDGRLEIKRRATQHAQLLTFATITLRLFLHLLDCTDSKSGGESNDYYDAVGSLSRSPLLYRFFVFSAHVTHNPIIAAPDFANAADFVVASVVERCYQ
ncbi:hypothetical protein TcWFU_005191 [Taenia crassiceps]|uniref:Uncharacterized protein n=1 Tax=Taenia crassiceps TaxID=6207 RepID=A0ABR4QL35_9CEST